MLAYIQTYNYVVHTITILYILGSLVIFITCREHNTCISRVQNIYVNLILQNARNILCQLIQVVFSTRPITVPSKFPNLHISVDYSQAYSHVCLM